MERPLMRPFQFLRFDSAMATERDSGPFPPQPERSWIPMNRLQPVSALALRRFGID